MKNTHRPLTNDLLAFINTMNTLNDDISYSIVHDETNVTDTETKFTNVNNYISSLPHYEQNIIYLYVMLGSYAAVARRLDISTPTAKKYINQIIDKIKCYSSTLY